MKLLPITLTIATLVAPQAFATDTPAPKPADTEITLDASDTGRVFEGVGAVSAGASSRNLIDFPEPQRSQILDYLFKPDFGASTGPMQIGAEPDGAICDGSPLRHLVGEAGLRAGWCKERAAKQ